MGANALSFSRERLASEEVYENINLFCETVHRNTRRPVNVCHIKSRGLSGN
jgi:hypothetical protein